MYLPVNKCHILCPSKWHSVCMDGLIAYSSSRLHRSRQLHLPLSPLPHRCSSGSFNCQLSIVDCQLSIADWQLGFINRFSNAARASGVEGGGEGEGGGERECERRSHNHKCCGVLENKKEKLVKFFVKSFADLCSLLESARQIPFNIWYGTFISQLAAVATKSVILLRTC